MILNTFKYLQSVDINMTSLAQEPRTDTNPYDRVNQTKKYMQWHYENVSKPARQERSRAHPKNYFNNKVGYTAKQRKLNNMPRNDLIIAVCIDENDECFAARGNRYWNTLKKDSNGDFIKYERKPADAKKIAKEHYEDEVKTVLTWPSSHAIIDLIDTVKENPVFNTVEAFTVLELAYRWTLCPEKMPYRHNPHEITVNRTELYEVIPKNTLFDPWRFYIEGLPIIEEPLIENALRSLSKIKAKWIDAVNEAFTPLSYSYRNHTYRQKSAIYSELMEFYDQLNTGIY